MNELVRWLGEQLDEDERLARAAGEGWYGYDPTQQIAFVPPEDALHIATHSPARVLREIEVKRQLVDRYAEVAANDVDELEYAHGYANALGESVRLLALPYADRPGYREEWRP